MNCEKCRYFEEHLYVGGQETFELETKCQKGKELPMREDCPLFELKLWYIMLGKLQTLVERPRKE